MADIQRGPALTTTIIKKYINLLLIEHKGCSEEYWPEVVAVRGSTKMTDGQYSPVRLKQARLVSSLFYGT